MKYDDVMIDIETMGKGTYPAIVSIGAVEFDLFGTKYGRTFYKRISLESSQKAGLVIEAETVLWWLSQSDAARKEITSKAGRVTIQHGLSELNKFMVSLKNGVRIL